MNEGNTQELMLQERSDYARCYLVESWIRSGMIHPKNYKTRTKQKGIHFNGQGYGLCLSLVNLIGDSDQTS